MNISYLSSTSNRIALTFLIQLNDSFTKTSAFLLAKYASVSYDWSYPVNVESTLSRSMPHIGYREDLGYDMIGEQARRQKKASNISL